MVENTGIWWSYICGNLEDFQGNDLNQFMPPKIKGKSENLDLNAASNLTLKTRHGEYARNETDPALRVQFDTSLWPKSKRSKSAEGQKFEVPLNFGTDRRSPAKSSDSSRSKSQSPARSVVSDAENHPRPSFLKI